MQEVVNIFNEIQQCERAVLLINVNTLKSHVKTNKVFKDHLLDIFAIFLVNAKKSDISSFVLFINTFFENLGKKERNLIKCVYEFLTQALVSDIKSVRRNSLTLLRLLSFENVKNSEPIVLTVCTMLFDKDSDVTKEAIKFLTDYQDFKFNKKSCVYNIFMDLIRHNPHPAIRKDALRHIVINDKTINCVVEKVSDSDSSVRKTFYEEIFDKLELKEIKNENLEFLIDRVFMEREFDYKIELVDKLNHEFDLENNLYQFLEKYQVDSLKVLVNMIFTRLNVNLIYFPKSYIEAVVLFQHTEYTDKNVGLDGLMLPELSKYIQHLYEIMKNDAIFDMEFISYCIDVLSYYDIFEKCERESVEAFIKSIVKKCKTESEFNSIFKVFKKILSSGEFIYNYISNASEDIIRNIYIVKYFLRYYKDDLDVCKRLIHDVILPIEDVPKACESLLYYIEFHKTCEFEQFFIKNGSLNELTDYISIVKSVDVLERIKHIIEAGILTEDDNVHIPICKLFMLNFNIKSDYLSYNLVKFYDDLNDSLKQYIIVFFNEFFKHNPKILIEVFPQAFNLIQDKKMFANHTLSWIKNSTYANIQQVLFYKIVCLLLKQECIKQEYNILISLLEQIEIKESWDANIIKKNLYCCATVMKRYENENKNVMNGVIGRLVVVDDGEPMHPDVMAEVKKDILSD